MAEPHVHNEMEQAFIVFEGEGLFRVGDQEHRLGEGDILFLYLLNTLIKSLLLEIKL